jgi:muramidase (phage lysozyme)
MAQLPNKLDLSQLTLDVKLEAVSSLSERSVDLTGRKTFSVGMFTEGKAFGITNIRIETNPSLQPIVEITFKDIYGNLAFGSQYDQTAGYFTDNKDVNYDVLFEWPPPKFELTVKGFLGKSIKWLLSLKKTVTTNIPDDGSYEIKVTFVPNIFGFFADIPFSYMYAVPYLKQAMGLRQADDKTSTIIDIVNIGPRVQSKLTQTAGVFDKTLGNIDKLLANAVDCLRDDTETKLRSGIPGKVQTYEAFKGNIEFKLSWGGKKLDKGLDIKSINNYLAPKLGEQVNLKILVSTIQEMDLLTTTLPSKEQINRAKELLKKKRDEIETNKKAIQYNVTKEEIGAITIGNVFQQIGSDSGFLLGKILQAGFVGGKGRGSDSDLSKKYYPLITEDNESAPDVRSHEMTFVDEFINALARGLVKQEFADNTSPGSDLNPIIPEKKFKNPLVHTEYITESPYDITLSPVGFFDIILLRSGIAAYLTRSSNPNNPGDDDSDVESIRKLADLEFANIPSDYFISLHDNEINNEELKNYCEFILNIFDEDGNVKLSDGTVVPYDQLRTYGYTILGGITHVGSNKEQITFTNFLKKFTTTSQSIDFSNFTSKTLMLNNLVYVNPTVNSNGETYYVAFDENNTVSTVSNVSNNPSIQPLSNGSISTSIGSASPFVGFGSFVGLLSSLSSLNETSTSSNGFVKISKSTDPYFVNTILPKINQGLVLDYSKMHTISTDYLYRNVEISSSGMFIAPYTVGLNDNSSYLKQNLVWGIFEDSDIRSRNQRAFLYKICSKIKSNLINKQNSVEFDKKVNEKIKGLSDTNARNTLYLQFRNIFYYWKSLINSKDGVQINYDSIPQDFSVKYGKTIGSDSKDYINQFCFKFDYPLNYIGDKKYDVAKSIINIDPLKEGLNRAETTVLNVLTNLALKNNFLFLAIPGNGDYENAIDIFEPQSASINSNIANVFHVMWSPTPEERMNTNPIEHKKIMSIDFDKVISIDPQKFFRIDFGSVDNTIIKSIRSSTEDNKATAESILYLNDLNNRQNSNKKPQFDCSMIPMMQGRSYKVNCETLGNAQISPLQFFGISRLPLFNGLYQILRVEHSIEPNRMTTNFEGIKLRYDFDKDTFVGHPPITVDTLKESAINTGQYVPSSSEFGNKIPTNTLRRDGEPTASELYPQYRNYIGKIKNSNIPLVVRALLDTISWTEGTLGRENNGYNILVGYNSNHTGRKIDNWKEDYSNGHQGLTWYYPPLNSTAAGRYQFLEGTWEEESNKNLRLSNAPFSKDNQDVLAFKRMKWRLNLMGIDYAYIESALIDKEKFVKVSNALAPEWASWPKINPDLSQQGFYGGQHARDFEDIYTFFTLAHNDQSV